MARTKEQLKNPITLSDLKAQQGFKDQKVTSTMPKGPVTKDTEPEVYKTPTERGMECVCPLNAYYTVFAVVCAFPAIVTALLAVF